MKGRKFMMEIMKFALERKTMSSSVKLTSYISWQHLTKIFFLYCKDFPFKHSTISITNLRIRNNNRQTNFLIVCAGGRDTFECYLFKNYFNIPIFYEI